ncbi:hypothetical protein EUTSA_v10009821mg, partial [Eutrema salsugineum]
IHKSVRLFSTSPFLTLGIFGDDKSGASSKCIGDVLFFDPSKEQLAGVPDKIIPEDLVDLKLVGASHGWQFLSDRCNHSCVRITDLFNPWASKSNTKIITLPPLTTLRYGQTKVVWNVAMSSPSPDHQDSEEEDCVVAIKFLGRQLSMCRPGHDLVWTNKLVPFDCSENSNIMFSKRDQRFYLPAPGGNYLCSWDLHFNNDPKFYELVFPNLPELPQFAWEHLNSCFREDHWVESPSGQSFLVKW